MRTCRAGTRRPVGRLTAGPKNGPGLSEMMTITGLDSLDWLFLSPEANYPVDVMRDASVRWDEEDALPAQRMQMHAVLPWGRALSPCHTYQQLGVRSDARDVTVQCVRTARIVSP